MTGNDYFQIFMFSRRKPNLGQVSGFAEDDLFNITDVGNSKNSNAHWMRCARSKARDATCSIPYVAIIMRT